MKLGLGKQKQRDPTMEASSESVSANRLKELCAGDEDMYGALSRLMFLDPKKINIPFEQILGEAQSFETQGNKLRAELSYRIAGGISLSRGDASGVKTYFAKAASFAGDSRPEYQILVKRSNEAVDIARKFYEEFSPLS